MKAPQFLQSHQFLLLDPQALMLLCRNANKN
jgi:hypothetical protein